MARHSSLSVPAAWPTRRYQSVLPQFRFQIWVFPSMACIFRLSDGTIARQLSTSVSLVAERKYRDEDCGVAHSTRGSPTQTVLRITPKRRSLSALAPTPWNANGHFHRRFYKECLHASRLTFNLLLVRRE